MSSIRILFVAVLLGFFSGHVSAEETTGTAQPTLKLNEPGPGVVVDLSAMSVSGTYGSTDGDQLVSVSCAGKDGVVFGNRFVLEGVPLKEGVNRVLVEAKDAKGRIVQTTVDVYCDLTPPRVALTEPKRAALSVFSTRVSGTVTDASAVTVRVNGTPARVEQGKFSTEVALAEGTNRVFVVAVDAAGHRGEAAIDLVVDSIRPRIVLDGPVRPTRVNPVTISGRVEDASTSSLTANGKAVPVEPDGRFSFSHRLLNQGRNTIKFVARDAAGLASELPFEIGLDTRPPALASAEPRAGSSGAALNTPISLKFNEALAAGSLSVTAGGVPVAGSTVLLGERLVFTPAAPLPDGAPVLVRASGLRDLAGNDLTTPVESRFTTIDKTPPRELVLDPLPVATPQKTVTVSGRTEPNAQVQIGSQRTRADKHGRFSTKVKLVPGERNRFWISAADAAGNTTIVAQAETNSQSGPLDVSSIDFASNLLTITFTHDVDQGMVNAQSISIRTASGPVAGTYATSGPQVTFSPTPDLSSTPFLVEITTFVTDTGGNPMGYLYARMFNRPSGGMLVTGEVFDDSTGLPLQTATVRALRIDGAPAPSPAPTALTGQDGRFMLNLNGSSCVLAIERSDYTPAIRTVRSLSQLAETIFDVRLTPRPRANTVTIPPEGIILPLPLTGGAGLLQITAPPYSVPVERRVSFTYVSAQGLTDRLPAGFSPVLSIDVGPSEQTFAQPIQLAADAALLAPAFRSLTSATTLAFVRWDDSSRQWMTLTTMAWAPQQTTLGASITRGGQYAWVVADRLPAVPPAPQPGKALAGLPEASRATSQATGDLSFTASRILWTGTVAARFLFATQRVISSGAMVQCRIREQYELMEGGTATQPLFIADLVAYNYGGDQASADFNISSRARTMQPVSHGQLKAAIMTYEEAPGGSVIGSAGGLVAGDGGAEVQIPAGALAISTVVTVKAVSGATAPAGYRLLGALEVSFGGAMLAQPAAISIPATTVTPGALLVAARADGSEFVLTDSVVADASRLRTPGTAPGGFTFTGVRQGGLYLFLEATQPMGFATGVVFDHGSAVASARVAADGHGVSAIAAADGRYNEIAPAGTARLIATHPTSGDEGSATSPLPEGALISLDLNLQTTGPRVAAQTPAAGATNVPLATIVQIIFSEPVAASTLSSDSFYITESGRRVTGSISLSADGLLAEFKPADSFASSKTFTITLKSSITDLVGNPFSADFTSIFTTCDILPPTYDLTKIRVVLPTNGMIRAIGGPGAIEPGATIWLFNERTGASVSTQGLSDGSFDISIPAAEGDRVRIRVIDLASNEIEVAPDVYTTPDGRGVQLDSGAHSYITPDGLGIATVAGTFAEPVLVRLDPITDTNTLVTPPEYLATLAAFRLDLGGRKAYKELDLSMPAPANLPADAQLFITREVEVLGQRMLMVMDTCSVVNGRIEVQSPPWPGVKVDGLYTFVVNNGMQLAFVEGLAMTAGPAVALLGGELAFVSDPFEYPTIIMPVPLSRTVTLTVRDAVTGTLLFAGDVTAPSTAGQTYEFSEPLVADTLRPRIFRASPVPVLEFQWLGRTISASGIVLSASDSQTVEITGAAGKAAPDGRIYLYRYTIDLVTLQERVEKTEAVADATGAFTISAPARVPDRLLLIVEKDGLDVWPVFEVDLTESIKSGAQATIVDAETGTTTPCNVLIGASSLTIRPAQALREERHYALKLTNLADAAGNTYESSTPLLLPFRTRKSTKIEVEPVGRIDGMVVYGEYIFAASRDSGVEVLDAADPGDLKVVGNFAGALEARAVALYYDAASKPWLVVVGGGASRDGYIKLLDITDPLVPGQVKSQVISYPVGSWTNSYGNLAIDEGKPQRVRVSGRYAFVAIHGAGMMIVDIEQMSGQTDLTPECLVGWYPEEWISELEVIKDGATTRVLLLVDYLGLKMLNVTNTAAITLEGAFTGEGRAETGGKHFNGLALAFGLEPDTDGDGRLGDEELRDDDSELPAAPLDLAFITIPSNQEVMTIDITSRTGSEPQVVLPQRILSDGTKLPAETSTGTLPMIGNVKLTGATGLGQIAFSARDRILYVLDATLGIIRISMAQPAVFTLPDQPDARILGTITTAGKPRYGLILDERFNMAYAGDLNTGLVPIKLAPPRLRVALKVDGLFAELKPLISEGLPADAYPTDRRAYTLVHLPKKAAQLSSEVKVNLRGLLQATDPSLLWASQEGFIDRVLDAVTLHPYKNADGSDPKYEDEGYGLFVSDPITLTIDPTEARGEQELKVLTGDLLEMRFAQETAQIFAVSPLDSTAGYLTDADTRSLVWRVPTYRVEWQDGAQPEPAQNPSIGATASVPGLAASGTAGVFLHSGEAFMEETDLYVRGRGLDFALTRTYNSQAIYSGPLGWGWDFNYHKRLQELPDGNVNYFDGHGRKDKFTLTDGKYASPVGVFAELTRSADGRWTLLYPGLYAELFDQHGRLARIQDRHDNHLEFFYDAAGRLSIVMDAMGRLYTFEHDEAGRLKSVTDFTGRKVEYAFDERGDLVSATLGERVRRYSYSTHASDLKLAHNLATVTDPKGQQVIELSYDADDHVTSEKIGDSTVGITAGATATVRDGENHARIYYHDDAGHAVDVTEGPHTTHFAYNADGLTTMVRNPAGNWQEYKYASTSPLRRSRADLLEVKSVPDARGGPILVTSYTYDPWTNQLKSVTDPKGNRTTFELDGQGDVTSIAAPENAGASFTRDRYGRVLTKTAMNKVTRYEYYAETTPAGDGTATDSIRQLDAAGGGHLSRVVLDPDGDQISKVFRWDARGNLRSEQDGEGNTVSYEDPTLFDEIQRIVVSGGDVNQVTTLTYDLNGNVLTRTSRGITETTTYNKVNQPLTATRRGGDDQQTFSFTYYNDFNLKTSTNPRGHTETLEYDGLDRLVKRTLAGHVRDHYLYDENSNVVAVVDGRSKNWVSTFDGHDRLKTTVDPEGNTTTYTPDDNSNVTKIVAPEGVTLDFVYDGLDRVKQSKRTGNIQQDFGYDPKGALAQYISPNRNTWTFTSTGAGLPHEAQDPLGNKITQQYDKRALPKTLVETEAGGRSLTHTASYDALGRTRSQNDSLNRHWRSPDLDPNGRLKSQIDPEGGASDVTYDALGRVRVATRYVEGQPQPTTYVYDPNENITEIIDALGNTTHYEYDELDRVTLVRYADNKEERYAYDENDQVTRVTQPSGTQIQIDYYDNGLMKSRTITRGPGVSGSTLEQFTYDGLGRLKVATNDATREDFGYDEGGRLASDKTTIGGTSYTVASTHDAEGNRTSLTYPSGKTLTITPDPLDRISTVTSGSQNVVKYGYEGTGKVVSKSLGMITDEAPRVQMSAHHDDGKRPDSITYSGLAGATLLARATQWNLLDFKTSEQKSEEDNAATTYAYDAAHHLTRVTEPDKTTSFSIDATDSIKRIDEQRPDITHTTELATNNRHQVTTADGMTLAHDGNGNVASIEYADGRLVRYLYDWRNQLVKVDDGLGGIVDYTYDALGRRVEKKVTIGTNSPIITRYVNDGWRTIEERDGDNEVTSRYVYGNGLDEPVEIEKRDPQAGELKPFIPMQDTNGSVLGLADAAGKLVERVEYTTYGKPTFIYDNQSPQVDQVRLVDDKLRIRFSEPIDRDTVEQAISVKQGTDLIAGTLTYAEKDRLAIFTPTNPLPAVALTVQVTAALKDETGNALAADFEQQFTPTGANLLIYDRGPPNIQSIRLISGTLIVDFDEEIDPASITNSVELLDQDSTPVATTITAQGEKSLSFAPTASLTAGSRYTLRVKTTVTDLSGKSLAAAFEQQFLFQSHDKLLYERPSEREHDTSSVANTTTFQGRDFEAESGLIYFRHRYLHPGTGRFLQPDPMGYADSMSLYQGFANNPANYGDPLGLLTGADVAGWLSEKIEVARDFYMAYADDGSTASVAIDFVTNTTADVSQGTVDMLRVGESTGEVIGRGGADAYEYIEAISVDTGRAAGLFATIGSPVAVTRAANARLTLSRQRLAFEMDAQAQSMRMQAEALKLQTEVARAEIQLAKQSGHGRALSRYLETQSDLPQNLRVGPSQPTTNVPSRGTAFRTGAKRGPKSKGEGRHNLTIERRIRELEAQGMEHVGGGSLTEELIQTPGGLKALRGPDITMRRPDGTLYRENVGRTTAGGQPIKREGQALDDLERQLGQRPGFTPYDREPR